MFIRLRATSAALLALGLVGSASCSSPDDGEKRGVGAQAGTPSGRGGDGGSGAGSADAAAEAGASGAGTDGGATAWDAAPAGGSSAGGGGRDAETSDGADAGTLSASGPDGGPASSGPPLAFPGAQGFGKHATGGREGAVYHVTHLGDSGEGSFRDAVSHSNRIVVFDVGGYIELDSAVSVKSDITIAGQSAPGEGIGFRGGEISFANASNVICRFIRVRPGSETESSKDDALSLYRARNVIIDHASFEFGPWNNIDAVSDDWQNHPVTDITIQDSLIADPTGQQFGAHTESVSSQMAWYRNIFANSHNRNPLAKIDTVFVNNLLYNDSAGYTTHTSTRFKHDVVGNYFVFGPASTGTDNTWYQVDKNQSIYAAGNLKDTNRNAALDGAPTTPYWYQGEGTVLASPWSSETMLVTPLSAASAARVAISSAGTLPRDALDALIIDQVQTLGAGATGTSAGTVGPDGALYTSQAQTGLANDGYGSIAGGERPADADNDGMPDAWERAMGSDPDVDEALTKAPDGYTLIEHYLNWLAGPHAMTSAGTAVDIDLSTCSVGFRSVAPTYDVGEARGGSVAPNADAKSARFVPSAGFHGLSSFRFTVAGSDGTAYTREVAVLVVP